MRGCPSMALGRSRVRSMAVIRAARMRARRIWLLAMINACSYRNGSDSPLQIALARRSTSASPLSPKLAPPSPCRAELALARDFPRLVFGPVLFLAFIRLAVIWRSDVISAPSQAPVAPVGGDVAPLVWGA